MSIPKNMQEKYDELAPLIIKFCDEKLNDEYNVNGFPVDIRDMPLQVQLQAFAKGIIPYVPGEKGELQ